MGDYARGHKNKYLTDFHAGIDGYRNASPEFAGKFERSVEAEVRRMCNR
jgi:hypothetical protein